MESDRALIVFLKNPERGRVKTRLAADVGTDKAFSVYQELVEHTRIVALEAEASVHVFYSDYVDQEDRWLHTDCHKHQQEGDDLGQRMFNAFRQLDEAGYEKKAIIGSDCPEITADIVNNALDKLEECDVVIGPSMDGGYYLLGMKEVREELFTGIDWSTEYVFDQTLSAMQNLGIIWHETPILSDVDTEDDLPKMRKLSDPRHQLSNASE